MLKRGCWTVFVFMVLIALQSFGQGSDDCAGAAQLCPGTALTSGNVGATDNSSGGGLCFGLNSSVWFKFTTNSAGGNASVELTNITASPGNPNDTLQAAVISNTDPCNTTSYTTLACSNIIVNAGVLSLTSLAPNTTYYILVDGRYHDMSAPPGEATFTIEVSGPAVDWDATPQINSATCGASTGTILVNPVPGPASSYTYSLDNGAFQTSGRFADLAPGTYTIQVKDAHACIKTYSVLLDNLNGPDNIDVVTTSTPCGQSTGSLTVNASGGLAPYTYQLNASAPSSANSWTSLPAGMYTIVVSDANGCDTIVYGSVSVIDGIQSGVLNTTPSSCAGNTGTATVVSVDPPGNYEYSLNGGPQQTSNLFENLEHGTDTITIHDLDNPGCDYTFYFVYIGLEDGPSASADVTNEDCNKSNGVITASSSTGASPFTFDLNGTVQSGNTATFNGLPSGSYTLIVTDSATCKDTLELEITKQNIMTDAEISSTPVVCNSSFGEATVTSVTGGDGSSGYTYSLNGGAPQSTSTFSNLGAGSYTLTVSDAFNCFYTEDFSVESGSFDCDAAFSLDQDAEKFNLSSSTPGDVKWYNASGSQIAAGNDATITLNGGGALVKMVVTTPEGCECEKEVLLPITIVPTNVFSPNGDGTNETWKIKNINNFPDCDVYIYSRWGERVFHSKGYMIDDEWDGKYMGANVPAGTYYYIIDLHNGMEPFKSFVTVVR